MASVNVAFLQVVNVEKPDSSSRALTVCVRGKRALRFSEVRDYQRLANTIRSRCGISASPQHSASSEVTCFNCCFICAIVFTSLDLCWSFWSFQCFLTRKDYVSVTKAIQGECQSLINHFEDNPEDVTLMVGQKDSSKAVSTEALMTVFHPQDVENLDPKMVNTRLQMKRMSDLRVC